MEFYDSPGQPLESGSFIFTFGDAVQSYEVIINQGTHKKALSLLGKDWDDLEREQKNFFLHEVSNKLETLLEGAWEEIEAHIEGLLDEMADQKERQNTKKSGGTV